MSGKKPRRDWCDVCANRRTVTLPTISDISNRSVSSMTEAEVIRRTFPCPQCAPLQQTDRLMTYSATLQLQQNLRDDQAYVRHAKIRAAEALMATLVTNGQIMFETGPGREGTTEIIAHVTLTGPAATPNLLDRMRQHQNAVASDVINTAAKMITDEDAMLSIVTFRQALERVMAKQKKELA